MITDNDSYYIKEHNNLQMILQLARGINLNFYFVAED